MRKQRRDRKQQHLDSKSHYEMMAEKETDEKAKECMERPAYPDARISDQARKLIKAQGTQMEHKSVEEYLAEKYDIKGEIQVGQENIE